MFSTEEGRLSRRISHRSRLMLSRPVRKPQSGPWWTVPPGAPILLKVVCAKSIILTSTMSLLGRTASECLPRTTSGLESDGSKNGLTLQTSSSSSGSVTGLPRSECCRERFAEEPRLASDEEVECSPEEEESSPTEMYP